MGSTRNNGRLVAGARFSAINNTGERGPADRVVRSAPVGAHDSLYSSSSTVRTHLRLRRGRFFLNEVTKLIFPLLSETITGSSLFLSLSLSLSLSLFLPWTHFYAPINLCHYTYRLCPQLYIPHIALTTQLLRRLSVCGWEARLMVGRSFWFMDGKFFLTRKMYFSLLG